MKANNKTARPWAFYILHIGPSNNNTSHIIFILSTKNVVTTPKCKHTPMAEDIITILGGIGRKEGMPKGIKFQNVHYKSIFSDLYTNEAGRDEDDSCRSDND